jgi:hypothetical protein
VKGKLVALLGATATLLCSCGDGSGSTLTAASPQRVMAQARAALHAAPSYHVAGMLDSGFVVDVVVTPRGFRGTVTTHGVQWQAVSVDGALYFRGGAMWRATVSSATAQGFADNWVRVRQLNAGYGWAAHLVDLPAVVPDEVFRDKPGLVNVGARVVGGEDVAELASPEDVYDVRVATPHYPVRWIEPDEVGADGRPCGIILDRFAQPVAIVAPSTSLTY